MTNTNGNGTMRAIEEAIRTEPQQQPGAETATATFEETDLHDPSHAGENAAWSIADFYKSAQHIRDMGSAFMQVAEEVNARAEKLATHFETEAAALHKMLEHGRAYSTDVLKLFEDQADRLRTVGPGKAQP